MREVTVFTEERLEQTTIAWFHDLGYGIALGSDISPDLPAPGAARQAGDPAYERKDYDQVVLLGRFQTALGNINPNIPPDAINEAVRKITRTESPSLIENNRHFHRMLTDSMDVEVISEDDYGSVRHVEEAGA